MKPTIQALADELVYVWPDVHVAIHLTRLRETEAGALRGTIRIRSTLPEHASNGTGRIYWNIISLTAGTDRKTVVSKLERAAPRGGEWEVDVDRCFEDAYERHTVVPEPTDLADVVLESPTTECLYDPILPLGQITLLLADQGSTKSYLMLYLAVCAVLGVPTVFGTARKRGPAIFFDWEVDEQVAARRLAWICRGLGVEVPRGLYYVNMSERGRLLDRARDMRHMIDTIKPVLIAIDSLTFATGGDLNSAEYAAPTMSAIGGLGAGLTKLVSTHPNKGSRNANTDDISVIGSGLFEFRARLIWHMKREASRTSSFGVSMSTRKPFDGTPQRTLGYRMTFDNGRYATRFETLSLNEIPELVTEAAMSLPDRIRALLRKAGVLDTVEIAKRLRAEVDDVNKECNRMLDIVCVQRGGGRGNPSRWALNEIKDDDDDEEVPWYQRD